MKILILSSGRSGSTALYNALSKNLNKSLSIFEPFNPDSKDYITNIKNANKYCKLLDKKVNFNNLIEKHLVFDIFSGYYSYLIYNKPDSLNTSEVNLNLAIKFYTKHIKNFDKVIILIRNNIQEMAESWYQAGQTNKFFSKYNFNSEVNQDLLNQYIQQSILQNQSLLNLSNILKIPFISYENLFSGNPDYIKFFLNLYQIPISNFDNFYSYFDPKNRLRQN